MSNQLVGLGTVPNVYIKRVSLEDNNSTSFKTMIELEVFDKRTSKGYVWSDQQMFKTYFKIALVVTSNRSMSDALKGGNIIPIPSAIRKSPFYDSGTKIKTISISNFKILPGLSTRSFVHTCEDIVPNNIKDYDIYAIPYVDMENLASNMKFKLQSNLRYYFGATTSEIIYQNRSLKQTTTLLLKPDKKVWRGPVHVNQDYYMAGAMHSSALHYRLKALRIENLKLVDNRSKKFRSKQNSMVNKKSIVGNLLQSINNKTNLTGVFSIDLNQLVLEKIKNGTRIFGINEILYQEYIQSIQIRNIRIVKQAVSINRYSNKLGSPVIGTKKINSYQYLDQSLIKEVYISNSPYIRDYQFMDKSSTYEDRTLYKYKVDLLIVDKSQLFLENKFRDLEQLYNDLSSIVIYLNNRNQFNYPLQKLKDNVDISNTIVGIVRSYYNTLSYFQDISQHEIKKKINNKLDTFTKGNYHPLKGDKFVYEYGSLVKQFMASFNIKKGFNYKAGKQNTLRHFIPSLIEYSKEWDDIILFADFKSSYDCLGTQNDDGLVRLTINQLQNRGDQELNRYFNPQNSLQAEGMSDLSIETSSALKDLQTTKNRFFAPLSFNHGATRTDLSDFGTVNTKQLTNQFMKSKKEAERARKPTRSFMSKKAERDEPVSRRAERRGRKKKMGSKKDFNSAFSIARVNPILKINNLDPLKPTVSSSPYVGENSEFKDGEANYAKPAPQTDTVEVRNGIESALKITTKRNKLNFDLTAPENFVDTFKGTPKFSDYALKNAPNHFKAMALSRTPGVKNNILESEVDVLKAPETKVASEMAFQTTQEVEMLAGYKKDLSGRDLINSPIWVPLDMGLVNNKTSTICRMKYTENPELGMVPNEEFKMSVQNSVFFLSNRNITQSPSNNRALIEDDAEDMGSKNQLSKYIMYATSNVVIQNEKIGIINRAAVNPRRTVSTVSTSGGSSPATPSAVTPRGGGTSGGGGGY